MPRDCGSRPLAALLGFVVAATCAATVPAIAEADDGLQPPIVATPDLGTLPALDTEIDRTLADAISTATGGNAADVAEDVVDPPTEEVGQLDTALENAAPAAAATDATPPSATDATEADSAPTKASPADTTPDSADTAGDSAAQETTLGSEGPQADTPVAATPAPQPPASPGAQLNVNLNLRISSPGSNGAVTQLNAATTSAPEQATTDTTRGEQVAPPTAPRPAAPPSSVASPVWYWQWDCVSGQSIGAISPPVSDGGFIPSSWTWIWNCGDNSEQYQTETSDQYQQVNANISIRIDSPGDDGSVTQANVAVSMPGVGRIAIPSIGAVIPPVVVDTPRAVTITIPTISWEPPSRTPIVVGVDAVLTLPAVTDLVEESPDWATTVEDAVLALDELALDELVIGAESSETAAVVPEPGAAPLPAGQSIVVTHPAATLPGAAASGTAGASRTEGTAWSPYPEISDGTAHRAARTAGPQRERSAPPRWQPASDVPPVGGTAPTSGATVAAAGPGSTSGVGLPTFLALLFLAAVLDLARRVALDRVTLPSGHWRRPPDTPG